jgi:hypothetical protein
MSVIEVPGRLTVGKAEEDGRGKTVRVLRSNYLIYEYRQDRWDSGSDVKHVSVVEMGVFQQWFSKNAKIYRASRICRLVSMTNQRLNHFRPMFFVLVSEPQSHELHKIYFSYFSYSTPHQIFGSIPNRLPPTVTLAVRIAKNTTHMLTRQLRGWINFWIGL